MTQMGSVEPGAELALTSGEQLVAVGPKPQWMARIEQHRSWPVLSELPIRVLARLPLSSFRVRDLLALHEGQVLESVWPELSDIPLEAKNVRLGWCEFEVLEERIGVRLTRLA
jgi:flagellar motor switch protein FliN/FliY